MAELVYERARKEAKAIRAAYHVPADGTSGLEDIAAQLGAEVIFAPLEQDKAGFIVKKRGSRLHRSLLTVTILWNVNGSPLPMR